VSGARLAPLPSPKRGARASLEDEATLAGWPRSFCAAKGAWLSCAFSCAAHRRLRARCACRQRQRS
jgi:hypothetical protein